MQTLNVEAVSAAYVKSHNLEEHLAAALDVAIREAAINPLALIGEYLTKLAATEAGPIGTSNQDTFVSSAQQPVSPEFLAASKNFSAAVQEELQTLLTRNAELEAKVARLEAQLAGAQKNSQAAASAKAAVQHIHPSGGCASEERSTLAIVVCSQSGAAAATALVKVLGAGWELHAPGETPEEKRVASAMALVVILSDGSLDSPAVVFAMRCALAYKKHLPHVLVHAAQTCEFTAVMPRKGTELEDLMPLYYKMRCQITPRHPHSSPTAYMKCAFSLALERDNIALLDERDLVPLRTGLSEKRTYSTVGRSVYA